MPILRIEIPDSPHEMIIEPGALTSLGDRVRAVVPHDRAALAIDEAIAGTHGRIAYRSLADAGYEVVEILLSALERRKSLDSVRTMYNGMLSHRLDRGSPVIAMGGGIVGDTAGFAAATFMRGVPLIHVPTTLLAMVDASIGGKTGVNIELPALGNGAGSALGKNLVGAFHQPRLILADPNSLQTLEPRDFACGLAESIKHGMIAGADLLDFIGSQHEAIAARDPQTMTALIVRSARIKIAIVQRDERETGERALLNLGHTFAHAIESMPEIDLRHGEAVAIGLIAASECAHRMGLLEGAGLVIVRRIIRSCHLPVELPGPVPIDRLMQAMQFDKKAARGRLRLVLPVAGCRCEIVEDAPREVIESAWREVGAR